VPVRTSDPGQRDGFDETVLGYTAEEAVAEASRCLDCDRICSLCVGVCPNLALFTYEVAPARADLPELEVRGGVVAVRGSQPFVLDQRLQVAVVADLCNECGTCVTACPTAGRPYVDKPRLYVDAADFAAESANAFRILGDGAIEGRFAGATHRLTAAGGGADGRLVYEAPGLRAVLERGSLGLLEAEARGAAEGATISLEPAAVMAGLLAGITGSLPHLPTAATGGGTRVAAPDLPPGT
jgi:putative selenate reductase